MLMKHLYNFVSQDLLLVQQYSEPHLQSDVTKKLKLTELHK